MTSKGWIIFATLCVAILGGMIFMAQKDKMDISNIDINKLQAATEQNGNIAEHVEGKADSKVVLIEYGDFQCPGCASSQRDWPDRRASAGERWARAGRDRGYGAASG